MSIIADNNKQIKPNFKKLPLSRYYNDLPEAERRIVIVSKPKEDLVKAIKEATNRNEYTVRRWLCGKGIPASGEERQIVADILQSDVDILFPKEA